MKILHLLHQYLPQHVGGVELNTHHLVRQQRADGHAVALCYPTEASTPVRESDEILHFQMPRDEPSATARFAATFRQPDLHTMLERALNGWQPEIVHVQHLMGLPASIFEALRSRGIPYVITLHDYWWFCANAQLLTNDREQLCSGPDRWINCGRCALARAGLGGPLLQAAPALVPLFAWRSRLLEEGLAHAAALTAPTAFTREVYQALELAERIEIVPNGIPLPERLPTAHGPRQELRIVYLGGISPQKGVHLLVEALNALPHEGLWLDIYGGLSAFPDYVDQIRRECTHPGVRWHGRVPNSAVLDRLAAADVLVVPSIWYETSALVIQEAFAVGVPVVASRLGAMAERVRHGEDGLLFEPNDANALAATLRRLIEEPSLLPLLRAGIRPVHTIQQQAEQLEAIYRAVVSSQRTENGEQNQENGEQR